MSQKGFDEPDHPAKGMVETFLLLGGNLHANGKAAVKVNEAGGDLRAPDVEPDDVAFHLVRRPPVRVASF
jgi:hypothetical protein